MDANKSKQVNLSVALRPQDERLVDKFTDAWGMKRSDVIRTLLRAADESGFAPQYTGLTATANHQLNA